LCSSLSSIHILYNQAIVGGITGLLGVIAGGVWRVFSGTDVDIDHKKKVDLGVLRDAECNGRGAGKPFSTVRGASVMGEAKMKPSL
jgi:hypothetical protein